MVLWFLMSPEGTGSTVKINHKSVQDLRTPLNAAHNL